MADEELRRALQQGLGPWPLVREAVSSTRIDRDDREGTHSLDEGEYVTKSGKVLTEADLDALADEAERGYDVEQLKPRRAVAAPQIRDCPECSQGKHTNCNGETWDTRTDDGFTACPCATLGHPA